jgi:hypothetical protein
LVIIGAKRNGRYYVGGFVKSTSRQKFDKIRFMIDTSEIFTVISIPDAIKNNIDYDSFKVNRFEICDRNVDAHIYRDCELSLFDDSKPSEPYKTTLEMVLIPVKKAFESEPKLNVSRLGLDVLQNFKMTFNNAEMMHLVPQDKSDFSPL